MSRLLYLSGVLAPIVFLSSVLIGGAQRPGYSHLADPVSVLGSAGAEGAWGINAAWAVTGVLIMVMGAAIWRDRTESRLVVPIALALAGAASAAIALWFPMDPPGVPMSASQQGHNVLVGVAALAFAVAMLSATHACKANRWYRWLTWLALSAMLLGGAGAALAHELGLHWVGAFERVTQAGYHSWLLITAIMGVGGNLRNSGVVMTLSERIHEIWRCPGPDDPASTYQALVHCATLAASSHNTQPWKFRIGEDRITILPDLSRRCPAVDPDDHHLYASLGCAAENIMVAAPAFGLEGHYCFDPSISGVHIDFAQADPVRSPQFEAIPQRRCSRVEFDGSPLDADQLNLLREATRGQGVSVRFVTDQHQKEQIGEYVAQGNRAQFADQAWAAELKSWIRFNAREAVRFNDGLYGPVMGNPAVPRWLGLLFMRFAFSVESQNRKDIRYIRSSAAVAIIFSDVDDKQHWIEAGRCYQRLALQAAALDLRTAFINQPVEVAALRAEFARDQGLGNRRPDLIVRVGRGPQTPRSLRRPVAEVLV